MSRNMQGSYSITFHKAHGICEDVQSCCAGESITCKTLKAVGGMLMLQSSLRQNRNVAKADPSSDRTRYAGRKPEPVQSVSGDSVLGFSQPSGLRTTRLLLSGELTHPSLLAKVARHLVLILRVHKGSRACTCAATASGSRRSSRSTAVLPQRHGLNSIHMRCNIGGRQAGTRRSDMVLSLVEWLTRTLSRVARVLCQGHACRPAV